MKRRLNKNSEVGQYLVNVMSCAFALIIGVSKHNASLIIFGICISKVLYLISFGILDDCIKCTKK